MLGKTMVTVIWPHAAPLFSPMMQHFQPTALKKFVHKSRFEAASISYERVLFQFFGHVTEVDDNDLPVASLRHPGTSALCADPCYLHPDRDQLRLFAKEISLTESEAAQLIASIQPLLTDFNATLHATSTNQWTLQLNQPAEITCHALPDLEGKGVIHYLPIGYERDRWIRLWNEIQMVLFEHPVNQKREARGELPVNAIWFWGGGDMPALTSQWKSVIGQDRLLNQLYKHTQIKPSEHFQMDTLYPKLIVLPEWSADYTSENSDIWFTLWQDLRQFKYRHFQLIVPDHGEYQLSAWKSWL